MTNVLTINTKEPIKKCDRCFHNEAVMTGGTMRKKLHYCSRYCSAKDNIPHLLTMILGYSLVIYLIKFEILPDPVVEYLDAPFVPSWDFSFGQIMGLSTLIGLVFWISVFIYSVGVLRKRKMEWIRLTFEEHMKFKDNQIRDFL